MMIADLKRGIDCRGEYVAATVEMPTQQNNSGRVSVGKPA
jgi:hypothetical protein